MPSGKMLAFFVERDRAPMGFQGDPAAVTGTLQGANLRRKINRAGSEFDTSLRRALAIAARVFHMNVNRPLRDLWEIVVHRVVRAVQVKDIARIPNDAELRIGR